MKIKELYGNPEIKRINKRYILIAIVGSIIIMLSSFIIAEKINNDIINSNIKTYADIIEYNNKIDIIKNFSQDVSKGKLKEAKEVLKSYGYDENLSFAANGLFYKLFFMTACVFLAIFYLITAVCYFISVREIKRVFDSLNKIIDSADKITNGEYRNIDGDFEEGIISILISKINYLGERVNNSISMLEKEKNNLKDFLADISHQLKTPLSSLIMFNDIMKTNEKLSDEDRNKFIVKSDEQLQRMEWLIMNLLKMGRLKARAVKFDMEKQPIREAVEIAIAPFMQNIKSSKSIIAEGDLDADINHDKDWLAEAFSNIIKNAVEHTDDDGIIKVTVLQGKLITRILISDNGKGMTEETRKNIFKRFYKCNKSVDPNSIGIGLSLSKSIIEAQNGEIKVFSELNKGTTFIISFMN